MTETERLHGLLLAKQYPNSAEPSRGTFNAVQVAATSYRVDWRVIAPVPWAPPWPPIPGRLVVAPSEVSDGVRVEHPLFLLPPRHLCYMRVADWVADASEEALDRAMHDHRPQFLHAHALYPSGAAAVRLSLRAGLPLVVSVHGTDLYALAARARWRARIAAVAAAADAIVCVSESLARDVIRLLAAPPERVIVIPDAYDEQRFAHVARSLPEGRRVRLLCVARLVDVKGVDVLVEALGLLVAGGADVELTIAGDGPLRGQLSARAAALGVADRLKLLGGVPWESLPALMRSADVYVQPSRREGFGVALVEALATGLPAVATRSGGPEGTVGEDEGVLVDKGDPVALVEGIRDVVARIACFDGVTIAARARSRFCREVVGARLVSLYERVIET
jgi:teichuronic acid biosynthesis glycosyltransferase TuaC